MVGFNAALDPLHVLRAPAAQDYYDTESRFGMPGLVLHNQAPDAVVGTSIVQDFDEVFYKHETGRALSRYLLTGGTAYEQRRMIETLLRAETPPELIIWGVAPTSFFAPGLESIRWDQFPEHLYTQQPSPLRYVASFQTFYRLLRQIPARLRGNSQSPEQRFKSTHEDAAGDAQNGSRIYKTYCGAQMGRRLARLGAYDYSLMHAQLEQNLRPILENHPEIAFTLFLPPYSLVQFAEFEKAGVLDEVLRFRTLLAALVKDYPHAALYDFGSDIPMISNLGDYHDGVHYGSATMQAMIAAMQDKRGWVENGNIKVQNERLRRAVQQGSPQIWHDAEDYCRAAGLEIKI
ncbi:MAG: hypothetical protein IT559_09415 [Alphaproteobacteria bacterium]|nr:hypothetical protein [Alphaproteobacteria bacterium]